jgi:hypothetical protein
MINIETLFNQNTLNIVLSMIIPIAFMIYFYIKEITEG